MTTPRASGPSLPRPSFPATSRRPSVARCSSAPSSTRSRRTRANRRSRHCVRTRTRSPGSCRSCATCGSSERGRGSATSRPTSRRSWVRPASTASRSRRAGGHGASRPSPPAAKAWPSSSPRAGRPRSSRRSGSIASGATTSWPTRARRGRADALARLPALRAATDRRVHLRWRTTRRSRLDHRSRRARLRRGLDLRQPRRGRDGALVPWVRLPALADGPARHLDRHRRGGRMTRLADRSFEMVLRNRVLFGVGSIGGLPEIVAAAGGSRVFVVTDPGVRRAGVIDPITELLAGAGLATGLFADVEPNPAAATVERGAAVLGDFGFDGTVVVAVGGGSSMDAAKAIDLRAVNDRPLWELEYDGPDLAPGLPIIAVPTTAGTGAEAHSFAVITNEERGRKGYIGHPSLLPVTTILDPGLTVGLPPAVTAV